MQDLCQLSLDQIVNINILQEIQDKFSEATGLAAVIVDVGGNPITRPSNFTKFCTYIRTYPEGYARCVACDDRGGRMNREKKPTVYPCHAGLTDLAAPIIVQDQYIGAFLAGQVILAQDDYDVKAEMFRCLADFQMDKELLSELFDVVEVVPEKRITAAADLIYIMSNYIVEIGASNLAQKKLVQEVKAKADLEASLRASELKALQAQVNPHFLFNTLNTIARLALLEGASRTQEVVYALSDLLRDNLRDIDVLRTLEEEIKSVKDYLMIQKMRFGDRIQSYIDIDPQIMTTVIPALTLQPLIENAIIHGLEKKVNGGTIHVRGYYEGDTIIISVIDTGVGVSMERIRSIFRAEKQLKTHGETTGLGIINVHKRIQHYYGSEYGLQIESKIGEGTSNYIRFPRC
ncbi:PocR ligand-binding domain-containing protein [Pelosinus sp. sgz500959]|uniref:sensor histidine kinase n=1 Tax=Pelosinus sp. sgz500959 TaxID=3242472 RepID=UPI00366CA903